MCYIIIEKGRKLPKKRLPFRLYAQILIFSALVALGALILWPLQQSLYGGMLGIRDNLISSLERQIGRKIRYSSISPSILGSFDVRNISIMGRDDIPLLTMSRFRITYSLMDILRGRTLAITSVQLDSPLINYNTAIDNDLVELIKNAGSGQNGSFRGLVSMLPEKITIRIRKGKCLVLSGNDNFGLDAFDFNAEIFDKNIVLDGKWNISVAISKLAGAPVNFQIVMAVNGVCGMDMEEGEAVIDIPFITGDVSSSDKIAFNILMREGAVNIRKEPDIFPFDASLEYEKGGRGLEASLSCVDFRLASFISFSGGLEGLRQMLDVASSGEALFKSGNAGSFGYSVNFAGLPPRDSFSRAASYEIDIVGDEKLAQIEKLRFSMPHDITQDALFYGDAGFSGSLAFKPFAPDGIISLDNFSVSGRNGLNADIAVHTEGSRINIFCQTLGLGRVVITAFNASLEPSEDGMSFHADAKNAQKGSFLLDGSIDSGFRNAGVKLSVDSFLAGDVAGIASPFVKKDLPDALTGLFGDTVINTEISLFTDFAQVSYNAPVIAFYGKSGSFSGSASVNGTDSRFELDKGQIKRGKEVLLLSARADFARKNDIGFSINADYHDLSCLIQGTVLDGKNVNIQGSYGLEVDISASGGGAYSGVINTDGFPLPFLGKPALLFLAARMRYDSSQEWSMDFDRVELVDIASPAGTAQFSAQGRADQLGGSISRLYYNDGFGPLFGNVNFRWSTDFSDITGTVSLFENTENYHISVSYINSGLNLSLSGSSIRLGRFSQKANGFQADGEIILFLNSADSFYANLNLSSLRGKFLEQDFNISAQAVLDSDELTVTRITAGSGSLHGDVPQITVNNKTGTAKSEGGIKFFINEKQAEGLMSLNAKFIPVNSWFEIGKVIDSFEGRAHVENFLYSGAANGGAANNGGAETQTFDIVFMRGNDGSVMVSGGPRNMFRLRADNDGNFYAGLSSPSPVRGTAVGNISGNTINASCNDLYVDIAGLFDLLPENEDFFLTGGYVNASVAVRGSLSDPEFFGRARGTSLRFRIPSYIPVELRPIPFNADIEGNEITFGPVSASVGKGAGSVSGQFLIARWIPNIFSIDVTVPRETSIPYSFGINGFTADGDASGKLNISMENMILDISGDLYVNNTTLGINSDEIAKSRGQDAFSDITVNSVVDLNISTGPVVEFIYPDSRFPILRANPDIGTRLHVKADTGVKQFSLTSDIKIRGGEIFYFERSFYIRSGLLVLKENELRFAPRLTARAEVRDRNENGPVTISMIVDNAPLLDFTARFESSPPLSQMEILALMGQSITGNQIDENTGAYQRAFLNSTTDILAQFILVRQVERQIRSFFQLDMFSLRTQLVQNIIFTGMGYMQKPVDRIDYVGNYFDNTTISLGKYIGQDMFLQSVLRYDASKAALGGGMTIQPPDLRFELQGPMFNKYNFRISWDFVPEHPENWWVNDNSITLTWNRSY
jgi:hypothetical protein